MKKHINNKVYDTDTAEMIGSWNNSELPTDYSYVQEDLYQKKTGEFFLHGQGGANTRYSKSTGNNHRINSEEIIPIDYKAAQSWAEEYLNTEEYEKIFGDIPEDDSKRQVILYLTTSKIEMAKRNAAEQGISLSEYVERRLL